MKKLLFCITLFISTKTLGQKDTISPKTTQMIYLYGNENHKRPFMGHIPDFVACNYSFHIATKQIGYLLQYVHPMSSSGRGAPYFGIIDGVDYDSFEVLGAGFAKDKNRYYLQNQPSMEIEKNRKITINYDNDRDNMRLQSLQATDKSTVTVIYPGTSRTVKHENVEVLNDIVFKKNDTVFVADEYGRYEPVKQVNFDMKTLKNIDGRIFQDKKDLFWSYNGDFIKMEDEQIVDKRTFMVEDMGKKTIFVGKKGFYFQNDKISNYQLNSYHFVENTNYYFYNDYLHYFDTGFSNYPVGAGGRSVVAFNKFEAGNGEDGIPQRDFKKVKVLGKSAILYDNKDFFYEDKIIKYDKALDISKLAYIGAFSRSTDIDIMPECYEQCIFLLNKKLYNISNEQLSEITSIIVNNNTKLDVSTFRVLNEYYFLDKKHFFMTEDISSNRNPKIITKSLNLNDLKGFNNYFADGKNIYYNCKKIDPKRDSATIMMSYNYSVGKPSHQFKTKNKELPNIDFSKLKIIKNKDIITNYLTDEKYFIFKDNIIGIIDYQSINILGENYIEDKNQYFFTDYFILKKDLNRKSK